MLGLLKRINDVKSGKTASLSRKEICNVVVNLGDAKKNLTPDVFREFWELYKEINKDTERRVYDLESYGDEAASIIREFVRFGPYEFFDGNQSAHLTKETYNELLNEWLEYRDELYDEENDKLLFTTNDIINLASEKLETGSLRKDERNFAEYIACGYNHDNESDGKGGFFSKEDAEKCAAEISGRIENVRAYSNFFDELHEKANCVQEDLKKEAEYIKPMLTDQLVLILCKEFFADEVFEACIDWLSMNFLMLIEEQELLDNYYFDSLFLGMLFDGEIKRANEKYGDDSNFDELVYMICAMLAYNRSGSKVYSSFIHKGIEKYGGIAETARKVLNDFESKNTAEYNLNVIYNFISEYSKEMEHDEDSDAELDDESETETGERNGEDENVIDEVAAKEGEESIEKYFWAEEDEDCGIKWYNNIQEPEDDSERTYVLPYLGVSADDAWVVLKYSVCKNNFLIDFNQVIIVTDDNLYTIDDITTDKKTVSDELTWEYYQTRLSEQGIDMMLDMGTSKRCTVRFLGEEYYRNLEMSESDKETLLAAYESLNYLLTTL